MAIKIIIADDHPVCRSGFVQMLRKSKFNVIGEATNGIELIELSIKFQPEIILTDIKMPLMDGIEATRQLTKILPNTGIIAMSILDEHSFIIDMIDAGARGYLIKNALPSEVQDAISTVYDGGTYYCKETAVKIRKILLGDVESNAQEKDNLKLTHTEREIIKLICQEKSNKEIATLLGIKKRTAEWHRHEIMHKINARNTAGVVIFALRHNIS